MQKPVNKKILSKKVIETSRLHLTYADVYKTCTTYGPSRWTASWTRSMDYPCGPRLIFEHEFDQRSKQIFGTLNGRKCGQVLLSVIWASHILNLFFLFSIPYQLNIMGSFQSGEGVNIFQTNRSMEEVVCYVVCFVFLLCENRNKNGCV